MGREIEREKGEREKGWGFCGCEEWRETLRERERERLGKWVGNCEAVNMNEYKRKKGERGKVWRLVAYILFSQGVKT